MKNIVLYKSKYGNTLQYAKWIAETLDWELRDFSAFRKSEVQAYDNIIFGTAVYIGRMNKLKKALRLFKDKPITIFCSGGNPGLEPEINDIKTNNFKHNELEFHKFFYLPGGVDFTKVTGIKKKMFYIFKRILEKKKELTRDEQGILDSFYQPTNYVDKKNIAELVEYAKNLSDSKSK